METHDEQWAKLLTDEVGTIYEDFRDGPLRVIIKKGPASLCAYFGIPEDHPLALYDYQDFEPHIDCHGGLTFSHKGDDKLLPKGHYWFGIDYSHYGDYAFFYDTLPDALPGPSWKNGHKWTPEDVKADILSVQQQFKELM
jgi:hypothetical protein